MRRIFGAALASSSTTITTPASTSDLPTPPSGSDTVTAISKGLHRQDDEDVPLPFASSRLARPNGRHSRSASCSSSSASSKPHDDRDAVMLDLLAGQALMEVKAFERDIMSWEEAQSVKKDHAVLANKIAHVQRSLALETKLRQSASNLVRLTSSASSSSSSSSSHANARANALRSPPTRPHLTLAQAEHQLETASERVAALTADLHTLARDDSVLRTRLLKHTAAVLALAVRRRDEALAGADVTRLPRGLGVHTSTERTGTIDEEETPSLQRTTTTFDGAHFFAGNRDAVAPVSSRPSPFSSPLLSTNGPAFAPPSSSAHLHAEHQHELHELRAALADEKKAHGLTAGLRKDAEASLAAHVKTAEKDAFDARNTLEAARREWDTLRRTFDHDRRDLEARHAADLDECKRQATADKEPSQAGEIADLHDQLATSKLEREDVETRLELAEQHVRDLELDFDRHDRDARRLQAEADALRAASTRPLVPAPGMRAQVDALRHERQAVIQAVGDTLRRHRTRSTLGPSLRELPSFDDLDGHDADLPAYVAASLNSHFDRVTDHVLTIENGVVAQRNEHDDERERLEAELAAAAADRDRLRADMDAHDDLLKAHGELETSARNLQAQLSAHDDRLAAAATTRDRELDALKTDDAKLKQDLQAAQAKAAAAETQAADATALHQRLMKHLGEVWKALPATEARSPLIDSSDLTALKTAFEAPRKPIGSFLTDLTSSPKFTIDALADKVKTLMADDAKLVQKLTALESEQGVHKTNAERAQKMVEESKAGLQTYQKQVKELETRMEGSSNQEVRMLEKLNDLTESLEQMRAEKRKLEGSITVIQAQIKAAEVEKTRLQASLTDVQSELDELKKQPDHTKRVEELEAHLEDAEDQLSDLRQELDDAKRREKTQRAQLLDELTQAQEECSNVRTQLRQEQRKKAKG